MEGNPKLGCNSRYSLYDGVFGISYGCRDLYLQIFEDIGRHDVFQVTGLLSGYLHTCLGT